MDEIKIKWKMRIQWFKRILLREILVAMLLFSCGCEAIAPNSSKICGLNYAIKRWSGRDKKENSMPPTEKCLVAVPYRRDSKGNIEFLDTEATWKASQERLVPYDGGWIPWKEKRRLQNPRLAELESQLEYSEVVFRALKRETPEKLRKYEGKKGNLSDLERALEGLRTNIIKPNLEAKLRYENAKREYKRK